MTKEIQLTQGKVALVDDEDFEYLSQWKWCAVWCEGTKSFRAYTNIKVDGKYRTFVMHRLVMKTPDNMLCDHINHNTLDNRKSELRNVTHSQNCMNHRPYKRNSTGVTGVTFMKGRYAARIRKDKKLYFLGYFDTKEKASQVYQKKAEELFGEYKYSE